MTNPWDKIAWGPDHERVINREWGLFYSRKQQLDIAAHYYNKSLDIKDDDPKALYSRSKCKRHIAQTEGALADAKAAMAIDSLNQPINLEVCDAIYQLNQFEDCKMTLHNLKRKFLGKKVGAFNDRITVVETNFNDSLGPTLGPFILQYEKYFPTVLEEMARRTNKDPRPLWKILKELGKCDVLSILEKEEIFLSPREIARRRRAFKVFTQIYFNKSWVDLLFLKELKRNPDLLLPQSQRSTPLMANLTETKYDVAFKFLRMLHARCPLYTKKFHKCPDKKICEKQTQDHLYRIQYQTRRDMLAVLRTIKKLRETGKIAKLSKYIEEVMGDYVVLKTHRVMPWKFEFLNEVYNVLGLTNCDRYEIVENIIDVPAKDRLVTLLGLPTDKSKERIVNFVFGDKSTYQEPDAPDYELIAYRKFLTRMETRMRFAKYPIERSYLLHEIARSHLRQSRFDECCSVARKAVDEAQLCNSYVWMFLGTMLICKAHAVLRRIERFKEVADEAAEIVTHFKSDKLSNFLELCASLNKEEIDAKKRSYSQSLMSANRSKTSLGSRVSRLTAESILSF